MGLALSVACAAASGAAAAPAAGTARISVSSSEQQGFGDFGSGLHAVSNDGRYVVFESESPLAAGDGYDYDDVHLRDRVAGTTLLVSRGRNGRGDNRDARLPDISGDGRSNFTPYPPRLYADPPRAASHR